jgi:hypothetical protein
MIGVSEDGDKALAKASVVGREHVAQPMERLHKAHGGTARPIEAAGRGGSKVEGEITEGDGPQATISEYADPRWNGVGESEIVGCGEAIDHHPNLALPGQRVDHVAWVGIGGLLCEPVVLGGVVEAASDPPQVAGSNKPVEGLIDRSARSQVGEVLRDQVAVLRQGRDAVPDGRWNAGCRSRHGATMSDKCSNVLTSSIYSDVRKMQQTPDGVPVVFTAFIDSFWPPVVAFPCVFGHMRRRHSSHDRGLTRSGGVGQGRAILRAA